MWRYFIAPGAVLAMWGRLDMYEIRFDPPGPDEGGMGGMGVMGTAVRGQLAAEAEIDLTDFGSSALGLFCCFRPVCWPRTPGGTQ